MNDVAKIASERIAANIYLSSFELHITFNATSIIDITGNCTHYAASRQLKEFQLPPCFLYASSDLPIG